MIGARQFVRIVPTQYILNVVVVRFIIVMLTSLLALGIVTAKETTSAEKSVNDVRVLIDISGSMKQNDPTNLRQPALNLFVSLLPSETHSGVWTFGQWVNMLVPHGPVTKSWKQNAKNSVKKINSAGLYTNIEDVIRKSTWDWTNKSSTLNSEKSLILLTDGLVDISKDNKTNSASRQRILQELLPQLQEAGVKIHAIALSNDSDSNLLEQLATATGGKFKVIETAKGLERLFLHLFESVSPTDSLPLKENKVKVDNSIKEMTFLVFNEDAKEEISIESPSKKTYSMKSHPEDMVWHKESHYDLITVKIPESGYWKINAEEDPDNRVMIVTDLKLINTKLPSTLLLGDKHKFQLHLEESGDIITRKDFLHFVKATINQSTVGKNNKEKKWKLKLLDNGKKADDKSKDGIYSIELKKSLIEGEHEIEAIINGTTFRRVYRKQITVHADPASASIDPISNKLFNVSVFPYQELIDSESMSVKAEHELPNKKINNIDMPRLNPSEWAHEFETGGIEGEHKITIKISANKKDGKPIKATLPTQLIEIRSEQSATENKSDIGVEDKTNEEPTEIPPTESPEETEESTDWGTVTLKVGIFNLFFILLCFGLYKYSSKIQQKIIPSLFEEGKNA